MATDWHKLRSLNGSQEKGFEELCCQLAAGEARPAGSSFVRKGTPDAGVECFWTSPSGDEEGWQAKYFLSPPNTGQWGQIDESVKTALEKHPRLRRYVVCVPVDRSDRRNKGDKSLLDRWNERVVTWQRWAAKRKMSVEFVYWGDHELTSRLNREENRGRHWFWFSSEQFTLAWFREALAVSIRNAGERYTPDVHVELHVTSHFAALGRTPSFHEHLNGLYVELVEASGRFRPTPETSELAGVAAKARDAVAAIARYLDAALLPARDPARVSSTGPIDWPAMTALAGPLLRDLGEAESRARAKLWAERAGGTPAGARVRSPGGGRLEEDLWACDKLTEAVARLVEYCEGAKAALTNRPALLLVGEAGHGKTHLLCDAADRDMQQDRPRILLHGSHFTEGEPWGQVVRLLGLNCSAADFLGALDAAGQAYGSRVVILIDALNEGPGRGVWSKHLPGMLERLAGKPWLGLAVSVRSSYESLVVPQGLTPRDLTRVVHRGFAEQEPEAVHRYFVHYGIQPTTPLMVPEFSNPLFLKLFCQGVKGMGWVQVPLGIRGITATLDMLLNATNARLSKPDRMDYDPADDPVRAAVGAVVRLVAETGQYALPRPAAVAAVNSVRPAAGHDNSLFRNLVAEGLLTENRWRTAEGHEEVVTFAYERFADHLLAKHLLEPHTTAEKAKRALSPRGKLGRRVADPSQAQRNAGLIEALSVQLPERVGQELFELAPHAADYHAVQRGFVASLAWRSAGAFSESTTGKIRELFRRGEVAGDILDAMLAVSPVPGHPLNADKLHQVLSRPTLAERDAWWSVFLHREWADTRSVRRLVEWTRGGSDLTALPDGVVLMTGTALAWLLTTSNRPLRDAATKSLVRLYENRLDSLPRLLDRFWTANDPYVIERLVAAAYGAAMRSQDVGGLGELASCVNDHVFRGGKLLPQLLTRDYARGLVEFARHKGAVPDGGLPESDPPHTSEWPGITIPSAQALERVGKWRDDSPREQWALQNLYSSIIGDGLSDFSQYVIGDMDEWTAVRLGEQPSKSVAVRVGEFLARLTPSRRRAVNTYKAAFESVRQAGLIELLDDTEASAVDPGAPAEVARAEEAALRLLTKGDAEFFRTVFKPFTDNPYRFSRTDPFDAALARRWMFQRVLDYGWTTERFGSFDESVNRSRHDRTAHKPERIGKKYQWIAYRELLARLSDNFYLRKDGSEAEGGLTPFTGPWAIGLGFSRDFDPSTLIRSSLETDGAAGRVWWSPVRYSGWDTAAVDADWVKNPADLPAVEPLLSVTDADGTDWLVLDTSVKWAAPARPGRRSYDHPRRMIWYVVHSYLVRKADSAKFTRWAKGQDLTGNHLPGPPDIHHTYLGECHWSPAYHAELPGAETGWKRGVFDNLPCEVQVTATDHVTEDSGLDCSVEKTFRVRVPSRYIAAGMGLHWSGVEGQYFGPSGQLAAVDPSVLTAGSGALLVRRGPFLHFLESEKLDVIWTCLGEKRCPGGSSRVFNGFLQSNGVYRLNHGVIGGSSQVVYTKPR